MLTPTLTGDWKDLKLEDRDGVKATIQVQQGSGPGRGGGAEKWLSRAGLGMDGDVTRHWLECGVQS